MPRPAWLLLLAIAAVGIVRAQDVAWICDDAFISLRYAENLVEGHGLVYNPGERVEGYTNLLWTLLLAGGLALGAPPLAWAEALGLLCYVGLAATLGAACARRHRETGAPLVPLAAGLVLVVPDLHDWATGGLETSLFAWLGVWGLWWARSAAGRPRRALGAGVLLSLLVLTRPDGLLWAGWAALAGWLPPRTGDARKRAAALLAPLALTLAVGVPAKLAYYGELLPTAFHAKSVLDPYPAQGLVYLGLFLAENWMLPVALGVAGFAARRRYRNRGAGLAPGDGDDLFYAGAALLYAAYVVWVGGDFMAARRLVPVAPLLFLALEGQLVRHAAERWRLVLAAAALLAAALPLPVFSEARPLWRGVADERRFYPPERLEARRSQARAVGDALRHTPARVVMEGGMCAFGFYSRLPYLVEMTGLTQYSLARLPLASRGRPGHEKHATDAWLDAHGIHLVVGHALPPVTPPESPPFDHVWFGDRAVARIHLYDDAVMDPLRDDPEVRFVPIEEVIALRRRQIETSSPERARRIYARLHDYYFRSGGAKARAAAAELRALVESRRKESP